MATVPGAPPLTDDGERVDVGRREVRAVVGAGRSEFDRQPYAAARRELVGVDPGAESGPDAGGENRAGTVLVERAPFAEHVDPAGVRRRGVQHRAADECGVVVRIGIGRDHVRAEVCRLVGEFAGDA